MASEPDMIYLYAFTDHPELSLPALKQLEQNELTGLEIQSASYQEMAVIFSETPVATIPPNSANIWRHEAVVEALMSDRTVLPIRFGAILEHTDNLQNMLASAYPTLLADLKRLAGRFEVSLQVRWKEPEIQRTAPAKSYEAISGIDYMLARLKQERLENAMREKAERLAAAVHALLSRLACEARCQVLPTPGLLLKAAYLIERERFQAFRQAVDSLSKTGQFNEELDFLCTGPWPPYSFTSPLNPSSVFQPAAPG